MTSKSRFRTGGKLPWYAVLVVIGALLVSAPIAQAAPPNFFAVATQEPPTENELERMSTGKVDAMRLAMFWFAIDQAAPAGDYNWSTVDPYVADAARNDIAVLPYLYGTPGWVAQTLDDSNCSSCPPFAPRSAPALAAWEDFVGAAVDRYGPGGTFWAENPTLPEKPIRVWQLWNEQNSSSFFKPKPNPAGYADMLEAASSAIYARDTQAEVVLGGMAGLQGSRKAVTAWSYLRKLYRQNGVKNTFDAVAPHPYSAKLAKVKQQVDRFRKEMKKGGDRRASMWITELGWSSAKGGNPLNRGKKGQAKLLKQAYKYFLRKRNKLKVESVIWYSWRDSKTSLCSWCKKSGLMSRNLKPKPAWREFTKLTGGR